MKIFHGPVNIAGIGGYLSKKQREFGINAKFIVYWDDTPQQNYDINLDLNKTNKFFRLLQIIKFFLYNFYKYDIFHFYFAKSLLPFNLDLPILRLFRKKIVMTYCGSDVRINEIDRIINPYAVIYQKESHLGRMSTFTKIQVKWQKIWIHKFYAARELYFYINKLVPSHKIIRNTWINNPVNVSELGDYSPPNNKIPILVHAPTNPIIKGSKYIECAIANLRNKGLIFEYVRLENIPNKEAKEIYRKKADIIIDQVLLGGFGTLAVEGMSYGKPVCCYLIKDIFDWYPDCPLVNCTIETLEKNLEFLIRNPSERVRIGKTGQEFVKKHADVNNIVNQTIKLYNELIEK